MGDKRIEAAKTIASIIGLVGDELAAIMNLADPKNHPTPKKHLDTKNTLALASGGASAIKAAISMLEMGGKKLGKMVPYVGGALSGITLFSTASKIYIDLHDPKKGTVDVTDVISVIGDVLGIASLIVLAVAGGFFVTLSAPVIAGLGILGSGLALISAGLSLITIHPSLQNYIIDTDKLSKFFSFHKNPHSFEDAKYIDIEAYLALPGSKIELIMQFEGSKEFLASQYLPNGPRRYHQFSHHNSIAHEINTSLTRPVLRRKR